MTGTLNFFDMNRFVSNTGGIVGATVYFYYTGTTNPAPIYTDKNLTIPASNPVVIAQGALVPTIFLDSTVQYRRRIVFSDTTVYDIDPITQITDPFSVLAGTGGAALIGTAAGITVEASLATKARVYTTRSAIKTSTVSVGSVVYLSEAGREGFFKCVSGSVPVTDTYEGLYLVSSTSGYYWSRIWDGVNGQPEWFGALLNNGSFDSYNALQACIDVTKSVRLGAGLYYGSRGLVANGVSITGSGPLISGYVCSHATDHLLSNSGTTSAFAAGSLFVGFALSRSVTPTTPGSTADDKTQGHGLHLDLVSNPRVSGVYTYNNLVEVYVARTLSAQIHDTRGIRQTGSGSDRWYGLYVQGNPVGMPGGWSSGPSGNPSCTIKKCQMAALGGLALSTGCLLEEHIQDLWIEDYEAGGGHVQLNINNGGTTAGDCFIVRPVLDGYVTNGLKITNLPLDSTLKIDSAWIAPSSGATSSGALLDGAHGLHMTARGDFALASGLRGLDLSNTSQADIVFDAVNCQFPGVLLAVNSSNITVRGSKTYSGANFGTLVSVSNTVTSRITAKGSATGTQKWVFGLDVDAGCSNLVLDVSQILAASAGTKLQISGSPVTTQGNVSGHIVFNPGAGAML